MALLGFNMYVMTRRIVFLVLVTCMIQLVGAQGNSAEFAAKYGPPEVERYQVTPEVSLTVEYARDRIVCRLLVEPRAATISTELVDNLLNELLPVGVRQGKARAMAQQMSCAALLSEDYDNVRIARATNDCAPAGKNVTSMLIQWKRPECVKQNPPH